MPSLDEFTGQKRGKQPSPIGQRIFIRNETTGDLAMSNESKKAVILVVDDEQEIREYISESLKKRGYAVLEAEDGKSALKSIKKNKIDIVITDIFMPGIDGLEVILQIREHDLDIRIIGISAAGMYKSTDALKKADNFGADALFYKPFKMTKLMDKVEYLIKKKRILKEAA